MKKVGKDGTITVKVFTSFYVAQFLIFCVINIYF